ncbi:MAG TPA: DNA cytosine methyltransferase [Bryobacteraceae bacterium]|nr:DNA cytosine methyltransferase [Bryobacteraceae bacterium]
MKKRPRPLERPPALFPEMNENPWIPGPRKLAEHYRRHRSGLTTLELCAGAGGQALGYEDAGIDHVGLVELDENACATLKLNRRDWNVIQHDLTKEDLAKFNPADFKGVDIISGGLPCPPFSVAGKQLGKQDERNLFPAMIDLVDQIRPKAVQIENVRGIYEAIFRDYRLYIAGELRRLGYETGWRLMNASDFGVPQLRPRVVFVAIKHDYKDNFYWPEQLRDDPPKVGEKLYKLMAANGWKGADTWKKKADEIAPTIVGGSHKHGGPDLGPTRARKAWATLGVDGLGIANEAPGPDFPINGMPKLTVQMVALLQGFPENWKFSGGKTAAYRQVGNAFPPPFAKAVAEQVRSCLTKPKLVRVAR